jgi:hypothetical protein
VGREQAAKLTRSRGPRDVPRYLAVQVACIIVTGKRGDGSMLKAIGYVLGTPAIAVAGGYLIFALWDTLIRAEIVPNPSLAWFPLVAVLWGCLCLIVSVLLFRRHS